jgi:small-conductance mechanosensitive channel
MRQPPHAAEHHMIFNASIALNWILFLALFPIAFFWFRRSWRILFRRDFSEVALKRGMPPADPARFAPYTLAVNLIGGGVIVFVIFGVVAAILDFETWTAIAGVTIWFKFFADYIVSRHAHPIVPRRKKLEEAGQSPKI